MRVSDVMQRHPTVISQDGSLQVAHELVRWSEFRHLPVVHTLSRVLVGVISERDVLRALARSSDVLQTLQAPVSKFMSRPVDSIGPDADLAEAAARLAANQHGCLPVVERGLVAGMLTTGDALSALAQCPIPQPNQRLPRDGVVASLMFREPIAVPPHATLVATAACMARRGVRHACVVDGVRQVIGVVSDRDVRRLMGDPRRALAPNYVPEPARRIRVDQIMSTPRTINQDATTSQALAILLSDHVGALPVVDAAGKLCGIVSYLDLLRHMRDVLAVAS